MDEIYLEDDAPMSEWDANEDTLRADCGCWESEACCTIVHGKLMCRDHAEGAR